VRGRDRFKGAVVLGRLEQELGPRSGIAQLDATRKPLGDLLQDPRVAVWIRERRSAEIGAALRVEACNAALAGFDVPDLAHLGAPADQVFPGGLDVLDDQEQALQRSGLHGRCALPELDRRL
jgi:hypothetical protein